MQHLWRFFGKKVVNSVSKWCCLLLCQFVFIASDDHSKFLQVEVALRDGLQLVACNVYYLLYLLVEVVGIYTIAKHIANVATNVERRVKCLDEVAQHVPLHYVEFLLWDRLFLKPSHLFLGFLDHLPGVLGVTCPDAAQRHIRKWRQNCINNSGYINKKTN